MRSTWLIVAAVTLCVAAPALAQSGDPETIEFSAPRPGDRAVEWSPTVMGAAQEAALPSVNFVSCSPRTAASNSGEAGRNRS